MQKSKAMTQVICSALLFGILVGMPAGAVVTFDEAGAHCAAATPVDVNSSLRIPGNEGTAARTFEIEVPFPGILTLDVAVRGSAPVEPKLDFLGRNCAGPAAEGAAFATIKRSAASLVLTVRVPGSYLFRIAGQDPLLPLEEYKLITGFLAESVDDEGLFGLKDEDPSEDEPEPDPQPFVGPRQNPAAGFGLKDEDPSEDEPEPDPQPFVGPCQNPAAGFGLKDEDPSEDEPEPDPQPAPYYDLSHGSAALRSKLAAVCRSGEIDDHGDTFNCATAFCPGLEVAGEIRNGWGDDHDLFMFVLTEPQTIAVETTGFTDTFGGLYDRYGHRLGRADDGGSGDNFRIAKTLSPGIYFVRAEGCDGAEGSYTLTVKTLN